MRNKSQSRVYVIKENISTSGVELFAPGFAVAQARMHIEGVVVNAETGEPLPFANIQVLSTNWGTASTALLIWLAAKIYRVGILMYGKKPSIREALKWLRYK